MIIEKLLELIKKPIYLSKIDLELLEKEIEIEATWTAEKFHKYGDDLYLLEKIRLIAIELNQAMIQICRKRCDNCMNNICSNRRIPNCPEKIQ